MFLFQKRPISIMVLFAITLHLWWAGLLFADKSALGATGVHAIAQYLGSSDLLPTIIGGAALMALWGLFATTSPFWIVVWLLPQQVLLVASASGAIEAMWLAQFADGVLRPRAFIAADQMYSVLAAVGHTIAIIVHTVRIVRLGLNNAAATS